VKLLLIAQLLLASVVATWQAPIPVSGRDRVYTADQTSNTVSVIDPSVNKLLGAIRLGDTVPSVVSPLYKGALLLHGPGLFARLEDPGGCFRWIKFCDPDRDSPTGKASNVVIL
jgi:YVTN family beta-propeller protein